MAVKERQRAGAGSGPTRQVRTMLDRRWTEPLPIWAWLVEHPEGLMLVDTGETAAAMRPGHFPRWHPYFKLGVRVRVEPHEELGPQLERLGFSAGDVRWVVLTHLHTDHAGGLAHVADREVLVTATELAQAQGFMGKLRGYLPHRLPAQVRFRPFEFEARPYGPFPHSRPLTAAGDVHLVATPGHTPGHLSVVVEDGDRRVVFAGDVSYTEQAMLDGVVDGVSPDPAQAAQTLERMRDLAQDGPCAYLPSHDPRAAERLG